jgi:DNA-binding transcriptional ArsR family regulator
MSTPAGDDRLDALFGALSDRTRRAMLAQLKRGTATVGDLAAPHAMSLPAVSRHLKVLERARLVRREVDGRVHHCEIDGRALEDVARWLDHYRAFWEGQLDSLAQFAERKEKK